MGKLKSAIYALVTALIYLMGLAGVIHFFSQATAAVAIIFRADCALAVALFGLAFVILSLYSPIGLARAYAKHLKGQ